MPQAHRSQNRTADTCVRSGPFSWIVGAVALVAAIEVITSVVWPGHIDRNNFFEYRLGHDESPERVLVADKLSLFTKTKPNILQVGDSSGFHGVMPPVIEGVIPGASYLNMSVFANLGYRGHYEMARAIMTHTESVRVLVLYVTPAGFQPNPAMVSARNLLGQDIWREFVSPLHALFHLPTLALRRDVTSLAYYGQTRTREQRDARALRRYPEAKSLLPQTGGWTREHDTSNDQAPGAFQILLGESAFPPEMSDAQVMARAAAHFGESPTRFDLLRLRHVNLAEQVFDDFRTLAEAHGAKLVIASAPVSEIFSDGPTATKLAAFQHNLDAYHAKHLSVGIIPLTYWPDARFSSPVHVATPYTVLNSIRFGTGLKAAIGNEGLSALGGSKAQRRPAKSDIPAAEIAGYGLSSTLHENGEDYRTFRQGRAEALIYAHGDENMRFMHMDVASSAPRATLDALSVTVFGEPAEKIEARQAGEDHMQRRTWRMTWRLPPSAMKYAGWMEILLSTRGTREWKGDQPAPDSTGLGLKIARIGFTPD